jgi:hypothetical protein
VGRSVGEALTIAQTSPQRSTISGLWTQATYRLHRQTFCAAAPLIESYNIASASILKTYATIDRSSLRRRCVRVSPVRPSMFVRNTCRRMGGLGDVSGRNRGTLARAETRLQVEFEHARNHDHGTGTTAVFEPRVAQRFGAVDEQPAVQSLLVLHDPLALLLRPIRNRMDLASEGSDAVSTRFMTLILSRCL